MTTTVKVSAHCGVDVEVKVLFEDGREVTLQNGDTYETYVYGDKFVSVREVLKVPKPVNQV